MSIRVFRTPEERAAGLSNIASLPPNDGGLFIFDHEDILYFWGKDTLINLDIAFITSDGIITDIKSIKSNNLQAVSSSEPCMYAWEMNEGWFVRNGFSVGDTVAL